MHEQVKERENIHTYKSEGRWGRYMIQTQVVCQADGYIDKSVWIG